MDQWHLLKRATPLFLLTDFHFVCWPSSWKGFRSRKRKAAHAWWVCVVLTLSIPFTHDMTHSFPFFRTSFFISQKYFDGVETSRTTKHFSQTQIVFKGPIFPWINTNASAYIQLRNTCSLRTGLGRVHIMIHSCPLTCDTSRDSSYTGLKVVLLFFCQRFFFFNFF